MPLKQYEYCSAAACFLAQQTSFQGRILVIEKDFSYQKCATARSAAAIRHQFSTPENIRMSQFGTQFIKHLGDYLEVGGEVPDVGFHEGGYLFLASIAGQEILQANHRTQKSLAVDAQLLTAAQLAQRFPWMNLADLCAGSLGPPWPNSSAMANTVRWIWPPWAGNACGSTSRCAKSMWCDTGLRS